MADSEYSEIEAAQPETAPVGEPSESSEASTGVEEGVAAVKVEDDLPSALDQGTLFRAVSSNNLNGVSALLKNRKIDINGFDREGLTPLMHAIYNYERSHSTDLIQLLLDSGAKATVKTQPAKSAETEPKRSFLRKDLKMETKKVSLSNKTPLLAALEFKSALYLRGWEYRHWDTLLHLLAVATRSELAQTAAAEPPSFSLLESAPINPTVAALAASGSPAGGLARTSSISSPTVTAQSGAVPSVEDGWAAVFASGKHDLVEVWAEGQHVEALKLLLVTASKRFRFELGKAAALSSQRLTIDDASFTIVKAIVEFLYSGQVPDAFMQSRGLDLLLAANRYEVLSLKALCEEELVPTQDNWIKMLTIAIECNSTALEAKVATSIRDVMENRSATRRVIRPKYAASLHPEGGPAQLSLLSTVINDHNHN